MSPVSPSRAVLTFRGAGVPAFAGDAGGGPEGAPVRVDGRARWREVFPARADATPFRRSIEAFFDLGGRCCYVLHLGELSDAPDGVAGARLLGEDGGPGYRTGLHSLTRFEHVSTVASPGQTQPAAREALLRYAVARPSISIIVEGPGGPPVDFVGRVRSLETASERGTLPLGDRVAWLPWGSGSDRFGDAQLTVETPPSGVVLGALEAAERQDLSLTRDELLDRLLSWSTDEAIEAAVDAGVPTLGRAVKSLRAWRRVEALRRAVEWGTRWVLFEINDEFLAPRVERELRGFLLDLEREGRLPRGVRADDIEVRCAADPSAAERGVLDVRVRWRAPAARQAASVAAPPDDDVAADAST